MARRAALLTHSHHADTAAAVELACDTARRLRVEIVVSLEEASKHDLRERDGLRVRDDAASCCDVVIAFGGDGTTLRALRAALPTSPPVFAINFGSVGFLRTADQESVATTLKSALTGDFDTMTVSALAYEAPGVRGLGFNDVVIRPPGHSIATLSVVIDGQFFAAFRGDGVIVATPLGSTGYNLASGGPALAWGVEGYVVSFLAPHTVAHRPVVAGPEHPVAIRNAGSAPVELIVDGHPTGQLVDDSTLTVRYQPSTARLARVPNGGFFARYNAQFGALS
jgi:NAD+ kinase